MRRLTPKEERFCEAYFETRSGSEAYRVAYNHTTGTDITCATNAFRTLRRPEVRARIRELRAEHHAAHKATVRRVLAEYSKLAFLDVRKAFDADGNLKHIQDMDDDTAAAIAAMEIEELFEHGKSDPDLEEQGHGGALRRGKGKVHIGRVKKIKLADKRAALSDLAKHLDMFVEKSHTTSEITVSVNIFSKEPDE